MQPDNLIPLNKVVEKTSPSGTTIWRMEKRGEFPTRRKISPQRVAWSESEVQDWINSQLKSA